MRLKIAILLAWKITTVCSYIFPEPGRSSQPPHAGVWSDDLNPSPDRNKPRINALCNIEEETDVNIYLENFPDEVIIYSAHKNDILYSNPQRCDYKVRNSATVAFDSSCFSGDTLDVGPFEFYIVNAREIETNPIATNARNMPEQTYFSLDCHTESNRPAIDVQITDPETTEVSLWDMIGQFGDLTSRVQIKINNVLRIPFDNDRVALGKSIELKRDIEMRTYRENAYVQSCQLHMPTAFNSYRNISLIENGCALPNFKDTEFRAFHHREGEKAFLVMTFKSFAFKLFRKYQIKCDMNNAPSPDDLPRCR